PLRGRRLAPTGAVCVSLRPFLSVSCTRALPMIVCRSTMAQPATSEHLPVAVLKISSHAPERNVIEYASGFIKRGCVIGIPTDTFYGLCADPFNLAAIERVFQIKGRPRSEALPILVNSVEQAIALV